MISVARRNGNSSAVLLDLDGVFVNTEGLKSLTHEEVARSFDSSLPTDFYREVIGQSKDDIAAHILRIGMIDTSVAEYNKAFNSFYRSRLTKSLEVTPGGIDFVRELHSRGYLCGLVSSSRATVVADILAILHLPLLFNVIVTAADVTLQKPSPEPYNLALSSLSVDPSRAVAIEDTEPGLAAARSAGLEVLAVKHHYNVFHDMTGAAAFLDDFRDYEAIADRVDSLLHQAETTQSKQ